MMNFNTDDAVVQKIVYQKNNQILAYDVLRLDLIHKTISGNKFFKLKEPVKKAIEEKCNTIATFGGAFSNHIVATACYCNMNGLKSIGFIRGEENKKLNHTLLQALDFGMELHFLDRASYANKEAIKQQYPIPNCYWINEGGYSKDGAFGVMDIFKLFNNSYTKIICAMGTGTTMAGIIKATKPNQTVVGICVLKGYTNAEKDIRFLLNPDEQKKPFSIHHQYHFNGYAKHTPPLIDWMNSFYNQTQIPTDFVYTAKLFYGAEQLFLDQYFSQNDNVLIIHSGGLQGNKSLSANSLIF